MEKLIYKKQDTGFTRIVNFAAVQLWWTRSCAAPKSTTGFTLIETLVAIAILTTGVVAPLTLATQGLSAAFFARDQITAFYLGQEAIEYVRNRRDQNFLQGRDWLEGFRECIGASCIVDIPNDTTEVCVGSCDPLLFNDETNFYNYQVGEASIFTREVTLTMVNDDEVTVDVILSWSTGTRAKSFVVKDNMLNWLKGIAQVGESGGNEAGDTGGDVPVPPPPLTQAGSLTISTASANFGTSDLQGVIFENTSSENIVIDAVTLTWTGGQLISGVNISGTTLWGRSGRRVVGDPRGSQPSGVRLDIVDFTLSGNAIQEVQQFRFDGNMSGNTLTILVEMADGSTKLTGSFSP